MVVGVGGRCDLANYGCNMNAWLPVALLIVMKAGLYWLHVRGRDSGEWQFASGYRMRRWVNGAWEYRPMTGEEIVEYQDAKAW
jgi:hypothetical protein